MKIDWKGMQVEIDNIYGLEFYTLSELKARAAKGRDISTSTFIRPQRFCAMDIQSASVADDRA